MKISTSFKKQILEIIRKFGYDLVGVKKIVKHNSFDAIHNFLVKQSENKSKIFFDVGANIGQTIERFLKIYNNPNIHSFEPTPELSDQLRIKYKDFKNIKINNCGLGNTNNKLIFNSYKSPVLNSFIPIRKKSKFEQSRMLVSKSSDKDFEKKIEVNVTTIDKYCEDNQISYIDLLKIETQGFEDKVLEGAQNLLKKNKVLIIELSLIFGVAYNKTLSFYDVEKFLNLYNYKLIAISDPGNIISHSSYQTNLIYVNENIHNYIKNLQLENIEIPNVTNKVSSDYPFSY